MKRTEPKVIELSVEQVQEILQRLAPVTNDKDYETIRGVFESYAYLTDLLGKKSTTIGRLRKMLFGASTEKTSAVIGNASAM